MISARRVATKDSGRKAHRRGQQAQSWTAKTQPLMRFALLPLIAILGIGSGVAVGLLLAGARRQPIPEDAARGIAADALKKVFSAAMPMPTKADIDNLSDEISGLRAEIKSTNVTNEKITDSLTSIKDEVSNLKKNVQQSNESFQTYLSISISEYLESVASDFRRYATANDVALVYKARLSVRYPQMDYRIYLEAFALSGIGHVSSVGTLKKWDRDLVSLASKALKSIPSGISRATRLDKRETYFEKYADRVDGDSTQYGDWRMNVDTYGEFIDILQRMLDHCKQQIEMNG